MKQLELDFREWKPVEGFEGLYDLRSDGLLYSHPRETTKGGYTYGRKVGKGYLSFSLSKNGKIAYKRAHILVYETFVGEVPKGYDVHHINHNPSDNRVENLELIERHKHNQMHFNENPNKMINATKKAIAQYTLECEFVAEYPSLSEATRKTNIKNISRAVNNKKFFKNGKWHTYKTAGGYIWKYKEVA